MLTIFCRWKYLDLPLLFQLGFLGGSSVKNPACNAGDLAGPQGTVQSGLVGSLQ